MMYCFPILNDQELLPCLEDMELSLTAAQLVKPSYEVVRPIYEGVVTILMGIPREELYQPVFMAIDALEFPELHDESIPTLAFIKHLSKLLDVSGVTDFSIKDLYKPETPRLRRNLSALINFAKFREEKLGPYSEMQECLGELLVEQQELQDSHAQLVRELDMAKAEWSAGGPEIAQLEAETLEVYSENQDLNKQSGALNAETKKLKQQITVLSEEAANAKFKLLSVSQAADSLRSQVVESPEKLQQMLEDMQTALERERALVAEAERRQRELQAHQETIAKVEKEVSKAVKGMEEVEAEVAKKKENSRKVKDMNREIESVENEALQLVATEQHLKRLQANLADRLQRLESQSAARKEEAVSSVQEQLRDKEALEAANAAMHEEIEENDAQVRALQEKIAELESTHQAQVSHVMERYDALRRRVAEYHSKLEAAMMQLDARQSQPESKAGLRASISRVSLMR